MTVSRNNGCFDVICVLKPGQGSAVQRSELQGYHPVSSPRVARTCPYLSGLGRENGLEKNGPGVKETVMMLLASHELPVT